MDVGTVFQIVLSSCVAAATTLFVNARQERERISCFVDWKFVERDDGFEEFPYLGVHNRSSQPIAIHSVRFAKGGVFYRAPEQATALDFDDPTDLAFPYLVEPGKIRVLVLDGDQASRLANEPRGLKLRMLKWLGIQRISLEVRTTARTLLFIDAEGSLPWDAQIPRLRD